MQRNPDIAITKLHTIESNCVIALIEVRSNTFAGIEDSDAVIFQMLIAEARVNDIVRIIRENHMVFLRQRLNKLVVSFIKSLEEINEFHLSIFLQLPALLLFDDTISIVHARLKPRTPE